MMGKNILLLGLDEDIRTKYQPVLEIKYSVKSTADPSLAYEMIQGDFPDLVLCNMSLKGSVITEEGVAIIEYGWQFEKCLREAGIALPFFFVRISGDHCPHTERIWLEGWVVLQADTCTEVQLFNSVQAAVGN
ncbi:MAG: hypothetical protein K0S20_77 [Patescibacteria group bacterium]|jgi:hypothetical protein|nr:hypothetical protein [Patescibacteria group bacterium]